VRVSGEVFDYAAGGAKQLPSEVAKVLSALETSYSYLLTPVSE